MLDYKTYCWAPTINKQLHPFIQCLYYYEHGVELIPNDELTELKDSLRIDRLWRSNYEDLERIAEYEGYCVEVWRPVEIEGGREIIHAKTMNPEGKKRMKLLQNTYTSKNHAWLILIPNTNGYCKFVEYKYCNSCARWLAKNFQQHIKDCIKCPCGSSFTRGSNHNLTCPVAQKGSTPFKKKRAATIYVREKNDYNISNCYFGDLETLIGPRGHHTVYAASCSDYQEEEMAEGSNIWIGEYSLAHMMKKIVEDYNGVFWFFNGSRFDCYFILKHCVKNRIPILKVVPQGSAIILMKIKTLKGSITFKDLNRFLPGSLDANCKQFGLPPDKSKQEFDHLKIKTMLNVEQFREEILKYLWMDVYSLRVVYERFSKVVFDSYGLSVSKFVTGSHLAYGAFTTQMPKKSRFMLLKTPNEDENMMRELYRGGRVHCGRPLWKTTSWDEITSKMVDYPVFDEKLKCFTIEGYSLPKEDYDKIEDFYYYIDCNSLYPAAQMGRLFPIGEHKIKTIDFQKDGLLENNLRESLNTRNSEKYTKDWWNQAAAQVDIVCPQDLNIAFLMGKDKTGKVEQNLLPKNKSWYTGPELWEASKLGYFVNRIHAFCWWPKSDKIFDLYVKNAYDGKKNAERDTPLYTMYKNMLNSVTGKFGQRFRGEEFHIFDVDTPIPFPLSKMSAIMDEENNKVLAWSGFSEQKSEYCPYPIHLSSFILAHSKVIMSKMLRKMGSIQKKNNETKAEKLERTKGGYLEIDYAPIYGDTDSLFVHRILYDRLPQKYKGDSDLGQMKLEIKGKIIGIIVLAPKTYHYIYIEEKERRIMSTTKSKGIPHGGFPYPAFESYTLNENDSSRHLTNFTHLKQRSSRKDFCKNVNIKERCYICRDKRNGEILDLCSKIGWDKFEGMVKGELTIEAIFGSMVRDFGSAISSRLTISNEYALRTANARDYWSEGAKKVMKSNNPYPTSLPIGHYILIAQEVN